MKKLSYSIFIASLVLLGIGLVYLMSASSIYSAYHKSSLFSIFIAQFGKGVFGVALMIGFAAIPYQRLKDISKPAMFLIVIILFLTVTIMPPVAHARRWFGFGSFTFQPAEFTKLLLVIHLANMLENRSEVILDFKEGLFSPLVWIFVTAGLVIVQPNVSNAIMILFVSFIMLFISGANFKQLVYSLVCTLGPALTIMMIFPHSRKRILAFFGSGNQQTEQAMIGLGSGGWFGLGFGNSKQRNLHLPEAYGDFIYSIVGEETGIVGTILILALFIFIFVIGIIIAKNAKDKFGQYLGVGISVTFLFHVMIHVAVSTGLMPTTGIPLPFISHGGTSLWAICASLGILMNIGFSNVRLAQTSEVVPAT